MRKVFGIRTKYGWIARSVESTDGYYGVLETGHVDIVELGDRVEAEVHCGGHYNEDSILQGGREKTLVGTVDPVIGKTGFPARNLRMHSN